MTYGSLGAVIILLTWFYITGFMLLPGAEINSEIDAANAFAEYLIQNDPQIFRRGVLPLIAKRGDTEAAKWTLDRGLDANEQWDHWDSKVTPLHLPVMANHPALVRLLLRHGADTTIKDSKHDSRHAGVFGQKVYSGYGRHRS